MNQDKLREALETISALGVLAVYNGTPHLVFPLAVKERVDKALAASKPEPQAQAGEPEVVATIFVDGPESVDFSPEACAYEFEAGTNHELIALQSHREAMHVMAMRVKSLQTEIEVLDEAIAKKDAALKACVEALHPDALQGFRDAAITQAEGAMK